jgi:amino acid adenylation domain-containing protein
MPRMKGALVAERPDTGSDHNANPTAGSSARRSESDHRREIERTLIAIWEECLRCTGITGDDDFFDLGGNSVLAGSVLARIEIQTGIRLGLWDMFDCSTVETLAARLSEQTAALQDRGEPVDAGAHAALPQLVKVTKQGEPVALSSAQQRFWFLEQVTGATTEYLVPAAFRIRGAIDVPALRAALDRLVTHHDILRTRFTMDADGRVVQDAVALEQADFAEVEVTEFEHARAYIEADLEVPFDLTAGRLLRARLARFSADEALLLITLHHTATDGWSMGILGRQLHECYAAALAGREPDLPEDPIRYADFAHWQNALQATDGFEAELGYWTGLLDGVPSLDLPLDRPRPQVRTGKGGTEHARIDSQVLARLRTIASRQRVSTFTLLLSAYAVLLNRQGAGTDLAIGTPVAGRDRVELEGLVGLCTNYLAIRVDSSGNPSFEDLLRRTHERLMEGFDHQLVPFEKIIERLAPERDLAQNPITQTMFLWKERDSFGEWTLPGLELEAFPFTHSTAKFDLTVSASEDAEGVDLEFEFSTDVFDRSTARDLARRFAVLLRAIADQPEAAVGEISLTTDEDLAALRDWNDTAVAHEGPRTLHEMVSAQAKATPEAVAVEAEGRTLTYGELEDRAARLAAVLLRSGVRPDSPVPVAVDRSADLIVSLLAIVKAGGAFVPIETDTPPARVAALLAQLEAPVGVADPGLLEDHGMPVVSPDAAGPETALPEVDPDQLCAVYFTSGSTGLPKGVACTHRGWLNRMRWMQRRHGLRPGERVLHKTTLTFDDSAVEIFWPLAYGGTVSILPPELHRDPRAIIDAVAASGAVHVNFVPSMLDLVLETIEPEDPPRLGSLRSVLSSGEALRPDSVARFRERFGDRVSLDNTWGATEVSIDSTVHHCGESDARSASVVSIGRPFDNNEVYVLDADGHVLPIGTPGELCIGGIGLARGYLGDPAKTAAAFVPHPLRPGERLYRTGDRGRLTAGGVLEFLGRRDHQVKVSGVRIELGEVESVLSQAPGVMDAAVRTWEAGPSDKRLAAYVVLADGATVDGVRGWLEAHLSVYARPSSITECRSLPRLASGKLDRRSLPEPLASPQAASAAAPEGPLQQAVAAVLAEVLGRPTVGRNENFFHLGGHSLLAVRATARLRKQFTAELPISAIFKHPTVAGLADAIDAQLVSEIESMSEEDVERLLG